MRKSKIRTSFKVSFKNVNASNEEWNDAIFSSFCKGQLPKLTKQRWIFHDKPQLEQTVF